MVIKREIGLVIKPGSTHHFFSKCPLQSQEYGSYKKLIYMYVSLAFPFFSRLKVHVFPLVLVCTPDLFFSQSIYDVWKALYYCFLYLFIATIESL